MFAGSRVAGTGNSGGDRYDETSSPGAHASPSQPPAHVRCCSVSGVLHAPVCSDDALHEPASSAQPNAQNAIGRTALSCAAIEGHADTVAALLGGGAEVDLQDEKGYVPLMFASTGGHERAVQALLDGGAFVDRATDDGFTAVMIASMHGSLAVTKLLLGAGANPNARTYGIFATSLFNMVVRNTSESNVLHVLGAVAENNVGFTSLMGAATMAYNEIVTVLLRAGAITDTRDNSGWTAHDAAMYNRYATTASLLAAVRVPDEAVVQHNVTDPVQAVHCGLCVDSH